MVSSPNRASSPNDRASLDVEPEEQGNLSNVSLLESVFCRSEFLRVSEALKRREELAKEARKGTSYILSYMEVENVRLHKEMHAESNKHAVDKQEMKEDRKKQLFLKGHCDKTQENCEDTITDLKELLENERANKLQEELRLEKTRNERIAKAETDIWKSKYSLLEAWILRLLENNPELIQKSREHNTNEDNRSRDISNIIKAAGKLLRTTEEALSVDRGKPETDLDISNRTRKFELGQTSGVKGDPKK